MNKQSKILLVVFGLAVFMTVMPGLLFAPPVIIDDPLPEIPAGFAPYFFAGFFGLVLWMRSFFKR